MGSVMGGEVRKIWDTLESSDFWNMDLSGGRLNCLANQSSEMSRSCKGLVNHRIPSDRLAGKEGRQANEGADREAPRLVRRDRSRSTGW